MTERKQREPATGQRERQLSNMVRALQDGLCVLAADGRITEVNHGFCAMTGYESAELVGLSEPFPFWPPDQCGALAGDLHQALHERQGRFDVVLCRRGGERFAAVADVSPLATAGEDAERALLCVVRDVTAQVVERDRLVHAHEVAGLISWDWNPLADRIERVHGTALVAATGIVDGAALGAMLRQVAAPFRRAVKQGLVTAAASREGCVLRYPLVGQDEVWVETRASMASSASGLPGLVATTQDITEMWRSREALDGARAFWQSTFESLVDRVAVLAADGEIVAVNEAWSEYASAHGGTNAGVGANYLAVCDSAGAAGDADAARVAAGLRSILSGDEDQFTTEYACATPGEELWFVLRASRYRGARPDRIVVQHEDITAARRARAETQTQARLLDAVDASIIATDLDGRVTHWNQGAQRLYGWSAQEAVGQKITTLTVAEGGYDSLMAIRQAARDHGHWDAELEVHDKSGTTFPVYVRSSLLFDEGGEPTGFVGVSVDVSERVESEQRLRSAESYLRAVTDSMGEGLITLDGDGRVTYMNQTAEEMLGWPRSHAADHHAHMIIGGTPRHGGPFPPDEGPMTEGRAADAVTRIDDGIFTRRDGTSVHVSYTASRFRSSEGDAGWVIVFSDITERRAEQERFRRQLEAFAWVGRIRDALANDGFILAAQPIVAISSGRVVQHELLLRMRGQSDETIAPAQFLAAAEESGLIRDIDRWVLAQGIALAGAGNAVEINLSAASLGTPELFAFVRDQLGRANADPALVVFELTETALLQNEAAAQAFIERVSVLGCRVALDDFGTGYGGFTYLKRLPVHYLKIDREFVIDLIDNAASQHVVQACVALARGFGQQTVAEGVESDAALELLAEMGVDCAQGYAIGRPQPVEAVFG